MMASRFFSRACSPSTCRACSTSSASVIMSRTAISSVKLLLSSWKRSRCSGVRLSSQTATSPMSIEA